MLLARISRTGAQWHPWGSTSWRDALGCGMPRKVCNCGVWLVGDVGGNAQVWRWVYRASADYRSAAGVAPNAGMLVARTLHDSLEPEMRHTCTPSDAERGDRYYRDPVSWPRVLQEICTARRF